MNKQISTLRLTVTTACPLRCHYCFVRKSNRTMEKKVAEKAIKLLLESPGQYKKLLIYGGEPLLNFLLLKKIIPLARNSAQVLGKDLIISLATNGLLLDQKILKFFKQYEVKTCLSIDGQPSSHNQHRIFRNGRGSFASIKKNLPLVFSNLDERNISVIMIVSPKLVKQMYDNFLYLTEIGFRNIEIESVIQPGLPFIDNSEISWQPTQKIIFQRNLRKITKYIIGEIRHHNFFFLNPLSGAIDKLFQKASPTNPSCPFYGCLEVHPQGEMAFSPFLINLSLPKKKKYLIGNIKTGFNKNYQNCRFSILKKECQACWPNYYQGGSEYLRGGIDLIRERDKLSKKVADYIYQQSLTRPIFKKYTKEAKKRLFE